MIGKIYKIDTLKESRNKGEVFYRVYFEMIGATGETFWAKTDIVPHFRNYAGWKNVLKIGNRFKDLRMRRPDEVNADSKPVLIDEHDRPIKMTQNVIRQGNGSVRIEEVPTLL